jgi:hypothetical protein
MMLDLSMLEPSSSAMDRCGLDAVGITEAGPQADSFPLPAVADVSCCDRDRLPFVFVFGGAASLTPIP